MSNTNNSPEVVNATDSIANQIYYPRTEKLVSVAAEKCAFNFHASFYCASCGLSRDLVNLAAKNAVNIARVTEPPRDDAQIFQCHRHVSTCFNGGSWSKRRSLRIICDDESSILFDSTSANELAQVTVIIRVTSRDFRVICMST